MKESLSIFKGKNILITGHTGFKGSWFSALFHKLGANVSGLSNNIPTRPAHYNIVKNHLKGDYRVDVTKFKDVFPVLKKSNPDFVFHLAAQPIVLRSYENPLETFEANVNGTLNILESLRRINNKCVAIFITSDKCYDNVEWPYGYRENDKLGGKDPYSGSKGAAELLIRSYAESFFKSSKSNIRVAVGRAGNVVGGGDWAPYRIIPDCAISWSKGEKLEIRNPHATRPWQHVLEPLGGYAILARELSKNKFLNGEPFNFGPPAHQNNTVKSLVDEISQYWEKFEWNDGSDKIKSFGEAGLLKLNCDKSLHLLGWKPVLTFKETAKLTGEWYQTFYEDGENCAYDKTLEQIDYYLSIVKKQKYFNKVV